MSHWTCHLAILPVAKNSHSARQHEGPDRIHTHDNNNVPLELVPVNLSEILAQNIGTMPSMLRLDDAFFFPSIEGCTEIML
jgi:hypothetical protein